MAKTRQEKVVAKDTLVENLKNAKAAVFVNFQGLKVNEAEALRKECRQQQITFVASKKTVLQKALEEAGLSVDTKSFSGGVAVACGEADEVAPAQLIASFAKKHEVMTIFGGVLEHQFIDSAKVKALSALESKQELLSKLVGTLNAPVSGFVNVLAGNLRGLVTVLNAVKEQKA